MRELELSNEQLQDAERTVARAMRQRTYSWSASKDKNKVNIYVDVNDNWGVSIHRTLHSNGDIQNTVLATFLEEDGTSVTWKVVNPNTILNRILIY